MSKDLYQIPAVRDYRLITLVSLAAMVLCLWTEGYDTWALLPVLPGLLSLMLLSAAGPIFVLFLLAFLILVANRLGAVGGWNEPFASPGGMLLIPVTLVYVATHWRLISLTKQVIPGDTRRKKSAERERMQGRWLLPSEAPKRSPQRVGMGEVVVLLTQAILFPLLAVMLLVNGAVQEAFQPPEGVSRTGWGILLLAWGLLLLLGIGQVVFTVSRWWNSTPDEARMFLQDQFWSETRSEVRRMFLFLTQARLRRERKGDSR
jgi:hypothetical protein